MRILITGVSGFVGAALLPRLLEERHEVRALARDAARAQRALEHRAGPTPPSEFELLIGDALDSASLDRAMRGIEVAYYLIHSMEPQLGDAALVPSRHAGRQPRDERHRRDSDTGGSLSCSFAALERQSAEAFAAAARAAGVRRIVYLGGLQPTQSASSPHLASRRAVEQILLDATDESLALRASIVIGARSRPFRFLVRLIERLPVLMLPAWRGHRTQPIDERDIVAMLAAAATVALPAPRTLDVGGPEVLSYGEIITRIAELMLLERPTIELDVNLTVLSAHIASVITDERPELIVPLMESLCCDLLAESHEAADMLGVQMHSFDSAVEHALYEWEKVEPLAAR